LPDGGSHTGEGQGRESPVQGMNSNKDNVAGKITGDCQGNGKDRQGNRKGGHAEFFSCGGGSLGCTVGLSNHESHWTGADGSQCFPTTVNIARLTRNRVELKEKKKRANTVG